MTVVCMIFSLGLMVHCTLRGEPLTAAVCLLLVWAFGRICLLEEWQDFHDR